MRADPCRNSAFRHFRAKLGAVALAAAIHFALSPAARAGSDHPLFQPWRVTPQCEYTAGIEGPAADAAGRLYVVNFRKNGTIGILDLGASQSRLFASLPNGSIGNGIRFDLSGRMFVADYKKHNVFVFPQGSKRPEIYFHSTQFNQPNDLAIASDGTLYASDPNFKARTGQVWRIVRGPDGRGRGVVMDSAQPWTGTTNGIDLSPDGGTLYVDESSSGDIWGYRLNGAALRDPRLIARRPGSEWDGLRTDRAGNIYVASPSDGVVSVFTPEGALTHQVHTLGKMPTNLTFGGPDRKTVFVTQREGGCIEAFRSDQPGRE